MQRRRRKKGLMLAAIAIFVTLLAGWYGQHYWRIVTDEATAPAHSVNAERETAVGKTAVGDPHRYFASYQFVDAGGRAHAARQAISRELYDKLVQHRDAPLTVHYSRSRPDVNVLDMDAARTVPIILAALAAALWLAVVVRLVRG
jgi:hypothetical protein